MNNSVTLFANGQRYDLPDSEVANFRKTAEAGNIPVEDGQSFRTRNGDTYTIPSSQIEAFRAAAPDAESVRPFRFANNSTKYMTMPEMSKFLRSKEWREGDEYKADREERDRAVAERVAAHPEVEVRGDGFLKEYAKGLADAGGTAIGRAVMGALSRFAKFAGMVSANAVPLGMEGSMSPREIYQDGKTPVDRMRNNAGTYVGDLIDRARDIAYPDVRHTDSGVASVVGKAVGLGAGLAEFAVTPTAVLAGGHFAEGWEEAFDAAKARGATDEEAMQVGLVRGSTDAAITAAFKNAPAHRIVRALGYKPSPAVAKLIKDAGAEGIAGVSRGSVATAVGKQMLANAAISASEMGALGGLQAFIDDAVMQEATKGEIDWAQSWKVFGSQAVEQGAFGAVMGLLPTPVKVREAVKQRDAILKESLADTVGILAYARANPTAGDSLAQAWRRDGKISRRAAREAGLPEMDESARNTVGEVIAETHDAEAAGAAKRLNPERSAALDEAINGVVGGEENAEAIRDKVLSGIDDARVLDDPQARERLVEEAANSLFGEAKDGVARTEVGGRAEEGAAAKERFDANRAKAEKEAAGKAAAEHRAKSMAGMEERARRKADVAEYEKQEAERRAREEAEQNAPEPAAEKPSAPESPLPDVSGREQWPEYYDWLKRHGRNDTDKNWRKFVAENDLDPALADRKPTPTAGKPAVKPDGKGGMVPVEESVDRPRIQKPKPNFRHPTENHAEPPQESVETRPVAETGKETPEPAKPVETPSRASDAKENVADRIRRLNKDVETAQFWHPDSVEEQIAFIKRNVPEALEATSYEELLRIRDNYARKNYNPDKAARMERKAGVVSKEQHVMTALNTILEYGFPKESAAFNSKPFVEQLKARGFTVTERDGRIVVEGNTYQVRDKLKGNGFKWDSDRKEWYTETSNKPVPDGKGKMVKPKAAGNTDFIDAIERQADKNVESNTKAGELGADGKPKPIDEATKSDLKTHYVFQAFEEGISDSGKLSSKEGVGEVFDMFKKLVEKYNPARDENGTISMQSVRRAAWMIESSDFATKEQKAFAHKYGEKFRTSDAKPVPDGKGKMVKPTKDVSGSFQEKYSTIVGQLSESQKKTVANWLKGSGATRENIVNSDDIFIDKDGSVWFLRNEDGGISAVQLEKTKKSRGGNIHIRRFDAEGRESHGGAVNKSDVPTLDAESVKRLAAARDKTSAPIPDGKGKMIKPATRAPIDTTPLSDALAEAKSLAKENKAKVFEVKAGTTTVKFSSGIPESISRAEKLLKKLQKPTDWTKKPTESSIPKPPSLTVATGKKIGGFNDVSKDFVSKDDTRKALKTPIVQGGSIYATDGRAVIRMAAPKGAADTAGAPDCASLFRLAEGEKAKAAFVMDMKKAHAGLEQVKAIPQENGAVVEMWLSPSGEVMFRARSDSGSSPADPSEHVAFSGTSLRGAQFIGTYEPSYLSKIVKSFAKLGDGKVDVEQRGNMLWLKGKNADVLLMPQRADGAFSGDELSILMGGKTDLTAQQREALIEGNPALKKALKRNPSQDPLFSVNPDADMPTAEPKNEKAKLQRIEPIESEPPKSPEQEIAERLDLKRLDPKRRSDPKVLAWAKKNGRNVTNGMATPDAVRAYDESTTENTARLAKRWFPDTKIVAHKFGETIKRGVHVIDLRDTSGGVLGWFDPKSKEIHLLPGADPKTVAHEIMWHGTRDYITQLAAKGDAKAQKFLDMMHDVERNAPQQIKDIVNRLYARAGKPVSGDTLMNEYGAWFTMGKGGEALEKALQKAENRNWFAKAVYTVKEMVKDFLTAHGRNRVDLSAIDGMTRDEFVDFLAKEFSSGKTLGKIKGDQPPTLSTKETRLGKYKRRVYDQNAAVRDLERDIERKTGRKISVDDSVEAANALKYGLKEAANIETHGEMREFRKVLAETGIHDEDLEYYAALKAAAGRDAKIDARNIAKLTADLRAQGASASDIATAVANYKSSNASHIDPREARMMLNEIENGPDAANFKKAYDAIRPIIDATLDTQVKAGLVGAAEAAQWRAEEPNYIPFKNEYDAETGEWAGRGMSRNYAKPEHYTAKGRQSAAGDILAHIFMDHQAAKLRAIENGVRQKLAKLVRANPELGKVEALGKNETGIEVSSPNVVVFKDGGQAYKITLEGTRGEAIANAFTQRNQLKMGWADRKFWILPSFRGFARGTAGLATRLSPTFAVRNTTKDNIELANIVYSERGPVEGTKWMMQYAKTRAETLKNVANVLTGHKLGIDGDTVGAALGKYITTGKIDASTRGGKVLDRYIKAGGLIAGGTRAEAFDSIKKSLTPEAIAKEMRRGNSKTRAVLKHVFNSLGYLNEYAEMATRVGIFDAEIKAGKTDTEAALFARRATVDFNRHGDWTPAFNMFRLFSNSTLGATARAAAALTKSKYGAAATSALFVNGLARAFIDHFVNAEEDERRRKTGAATGKDISEYERRSSLFYFRNGDKLYKVAEHESPFSLISYAGDCVGRWICGDLDGKQVAKNLGVTAAEVAYNFLPMGSINLTAQNGGFAEDARAALISGVVPTAAQPIAELWANVDYAGRTIYNDPGHDNKTPRAEQGRDSTPDWAKEAAVKLNESTRIEGRRKGYVDVPPEAIQKLVEGYGKNALRDVSMAVSVGEAVIKGDFSRLDPRNEPVKRDFVRPLDGNDKRFGAARKEFEANLDYFKNTEMTEDERMDYLAKFPHIRGKRGSDLLAAIKKFRKMERGFAYKNGKAVPHEWPQEKLDEFKKKRRALQAQFLELMGD